MADSKSIMRRLADAVTMFTVSAACLLLLIYVAHGTALRTYEQLMIEKLVAQGQLVQSGLETYLRPGLPLRQYVGFHQITAPMIKADEALETMSVRDIDGERIFAAGDLSVRTLPPTTDMPIGNGTATLRTSDTLVQVILPLRNKFEPVGDLVVSMDRHKAAHKARSQFMSIVYLAGLASLLFALVVFASADDAAPRRRRTVAIAFTMTFLGVAAAVVLTMVTLFTEGAQSKGRALTDSLGQRLDDISQYGIQLDQIEGLEDVLDDYRRLNPDIIAGAITINNRVAVHTERALVGRYWVTDPAHFEYRADLTQPGHPRLVQVVVAMPKSIVYWQVARNVKNFAALFVASAFFAFLMMQVAQSMQQARAAADPASTDWRSGVALDLAKPIFFLAVFVDHLGYAFLPQFVSGIVAKEGLAASYVAVPFTAYYLCFALALMPAGRYELRFGSRPLILSGLLLTSIGLFMMATFARFDMIVLARAVCGVGQGMLFIGMQSYILTRAAREHRTKANTIIVFGFQAGMISGMAIGSLLVGQINPSGVFVLGALIAALVVVYTMTVLPQEGVRTEVRGGEPTSWEIWREIGWMLRDINFVKTIVLIGIPAKAVLTGIVLFAMPLLLHVKGFAQEDIGQITMIYAACVIFASGHAAQLVDRQGNSKYVLLWGAVATAAGLIVIATTGLELVTQNVNAQILVPVLAVGGVAIVGLAHGLINAPVVTHVTETRVAQQIGTGPVAAAYRFLERSGHTLGPLVMGQLFIVFGQTPVVLAWVGFGILMLGLSVHDPDQICGWPIHSRGVRPMTIDIAHSRRDFIGLVSAAAAATALGGEARANGELIAHSDWFRIGSEIAKDWDVVPTPEDSLRLRIKPKRFLSSQPLRRILVLYPRPSSAYDTAITKLVSVITDKRINADFTVLNFKNEDVRGKASIEFAESNNFDLIITMGSESTAWMWTNYSGRRIPVVSVCSKDPVLLGQVASYDQGTGNNFAFTSLNMPIDAQMAYVTRLRPNLKNLAILVDANNVSAVQTQSIPAREYAKARGVRVLELAVQRPSRVKEELAVLVRDAVNAMRRNDPELVNSLFWITGSTILFGEIGTINAHSYRVPILSTVTDVVQPGDDSAVLGVGISFESNAHLAAIYAADVLEGRQAAGKLHVGVVSPPDVAISFRKAREIGMKIPFTLFESASTIYDYDGKLVRSAGNVRNEN